MLSLDDTSHVFLYTLTALLPVVNVPGSMVEFHARTHRLTSAERHALARRVALYFLVVVLGALLGGAFLLEIFEIPTGIVHIAGGMLIFAAAWRMLEDHPGNANGDTDEAAPDSAFFPLTMPITVDMGTLSVAIAVSGSMKRHWDFAVFAEYGGAIGAIVVVGLTVLACYRLSDAAMARMGPTAVMVLTKLSAFILLAVAVEITVSGIADTIDAHQGPR